MKAAWDKLRGPSGKLGAPVGDQAVDGDVVSQKFTGGKISWNRAKNTFSTDPANLAPLLSGLQVPGQNQPSSSAMPSHAKEFRLALVVPAGRHPGVGPDRVVGVPGVRLAPPPSCRPAAGRARRDDAPTTLDHDVDRRLRRAADGHWSPMTTPIWPTTGSVNRRTPSPPPESAETRAGPATSGRCELGLDDEDPDAVDTDSLSCCLRGSTVEAGYPMPTPRTVIGRLVPGRAGYAEEVRGGRYPEAATDADDAEDACRVAIPRMWPCRGRRSSGVGATRGGRSRMSTTRDS